MLMMIMTPPPQTNTTASYYYYYCCCYYYSPDLHHTLVGLYNRQRIWPNHEAPPSLEDPGANCGAYHDWTCRHSSSQDGER